MPRICIPQKEQFLTQSFSLCIILLIPHKIMSCCTFPIPSILGFSRETEQREYAHRHMQIHVHKFILRNCLVQMWGPNSKPMGQIGRLEILVRINDVLSPNFIRQQARNSDRVSILQSWEFLLFGGILRSLSLKAFIWLDEADLHDRRRSALLKVYWFKC